MKTFGFPKSEHLCLQRDIDALFAGATQSAAAYPVRAVWRESEWSGQGPQVKVLVSVSKRKFKHAVDRNRAKRQMREAYRLNKHILDGSIGEGRVLHIAFIWLADTPQDSRQIHSRIVRLLHKIAESN